MILFLPTQIKSYLILVKDLLYPYNNDFSKPILDYATKQLISDYHRYQLIKEQKNMDPDDEYYFALFDNRKRSHNFYKSWAAVCILFSMRPKGLVLWPDEEVSFTRKTLNNYLYDFLEKVSIDESICPRCFLDGFGIDIVKRTVITPYY